MNKLSSEQRERVVAALVEGTSIRATVRMTGVAKNTVTKLLVDLGRACDEYQRRTLVGLKSRRIQCDEIWSFVYAKERNADPAIGAISTSLPTSHQQPSESSWAGFHSSLSGKLSGLNLIQ